jgi:RepB DNA-primase N-terminal domain
MCLDLDENGPASLHAIRTTGDVPVPTLVLDTSPEKNQVVWRVDGLERDHAESLLRSLATQFRGDPAATDISRVLRVPGFRNWKYNEPFQVRAIQETDQVYQTSSATSWCMRIRPTAAVTLTKRGNRPGAHHPRTGVSPKRNWAYAKRALARGDDPPSRPCALRKHTKRTSGVSNTLRLRLVRADWWTSLRIRSTSIFANVFDSESASRPSSVTSNEEQSRPPQYIRSSEFSDVCSTWLSARSS